MEIATTAFALGKQMTLGGGVVAALCFVLVAGGKRFGTVPTQGASGGRVLAVRLGRWIGLGIAAVGLGLMAIASTG